MAKPCSAWTALLEPVLHLAALAVHGLVEEAGRAECGVDIGDDEARVGSAVRELGFPDDATHDRPALARPISKVGEHPRRLAGPLHLALGELRLRRDLGGQPFVAGKPEQKLHAAFLAPAHQVVAAEATVGADHDRGPGPLLADVADDAGDFLHRTVSGIIGRRSKLRRQQMPAAESIQR